MVKVLLVTDPMTVLLDVSETKESTIDNDREARQEKIRSFFSSIRYRGCDTARLFDRDDYFPSVLLLR